MDLRVAGAAALLSACALGACGSPMTSPDGGAAPDAPPLVDDDAGADSGPSDAGPDAGPPPGPRTMARDGARESLDALTAAMGAVPAAEAASGEMLDLEIASLRLDVIIGEKIGSLIDIAGIIGEKSMGALSLPEAAIPTIVIARQLETAIEELDDVRARSGWASSSDPMLRALDAAALEMRDDAEVLRDLLWLRYRELVDSVSGMLFRDEPAYVDVRHVQVMGSRSTLHFVVEGNSAADPSATLEVDCAGFIPTVTVTDEETRAEILPRQTGVGTMVSTFALPIGHDDPRSLRVDLELEDITSWAGCYVTVRGHRHFRGARETIDPGEQTEASLGNDEWGTHSGSLEGEVGRLSSGGTFDPERLATLERVTRELCAETGRLRPMQTAAFLDADDYEIDELVVGRIVLRLTDRLALDPAIAAEPGLTGNLDGLENAMNRIMIEIAPGHMGPSS